MTASQLRARLLDALPISSPDVRSVVTHLIEQGCIPEKNIKFYLIYHEYPALMQEYGAMGAYFRLAQRYKYHHLYIPQVLALVRGQIELLQ